MVAVVHELERLGIERQVPLTDAAVFFQPPVGQAYPALTVEGLETILAGVPLQVFLVETVFGDVIQPAVRAKPPAVPSRHPEQLCCCAVGKQHKQRQKWTASGRCFLHLDSCHIAA